MKRTTVVFFIVLLTSAATMMAQEQPAPTTTTQEQTSPVPAQKGDKDYISVYAGFKFSHPKGFSDDKFNTLIGNLKSKIMEKTENCSGEAHFEFKSKPRADKSLIFFAFYVNLWKADSKDPKYLTFSTSNEDPAKDFSARETLTMEKLYQEIFNTCGCKDKQATASN